MPDQKKKPSVFVALFPMNERDGWLHPSIGTFLVALSHFGRDRALSLHINGEMKPIDYARNRVAMEFIASGSDWLLMIDNDMGVPPNLLEMLDRAQPDMKILVPRFHCLLNSSEDPEALNLRHGTIAPGWASVKDAGPRGEWRELVWAGTGCMFVHRSVFERLGNRPWFRFVRDEWGRTLSSEDQYFCAEARNVGIPTWGNTAFEVDHFKTLSLSTLAKAFRTSLPSSKANSQF